MYARFHGLNLTPLWHDYEMLLPHLDQFGHTQKKSSGSQSIPEDKKAGISPDQVHGLDLGPTLGHVRPEGLFFLPNKL